MLNHVRGATSYENLRTWRGITYATFRQACEAMGLVELDKSLDDCLRESAESTQDTQSTVDTPEDAEKLDSTPNMGAPDGSILNQSMIPSNEVIDARDSIDACDSQMNSDLENEKNLDDLLNCAESLEDTRVSQHSKPKKIFISVIKEQGICVTFYIQHFYIVTIIRAVAISKFSIQCRLHLQ